MTADDRSDGSGRDANASGDDGENAPANDGHRFDRLPETAADREVSGRASREEVVGWWDDRFGVPSETFEGYSLWEKGKGKIWILSGEVVDPIRVESLGATFLRTRQEHWKPTTDAVQRFGREATRNVMELDPAQAARYVRGEDQVVEWDDDWGYLVVAHEMAGGREPLGVGLYLHGELRSVVPKGRREELAIR